MHGLTHTVFVLVLLSMLLLRVYMCTLYISGLSFCVLFQLRKIACAEEKSKCLTSLFLSLYLLPSLFSLSSTEESTFRGMGWVWVGRWSAFWGLDLASGYDQLTNWNALTLGWGLSCFVLMSVWQNYMWKKRKKRQTIFFLTYFSALFPSLLSFRWQQWQWALEIPSHLCNRSIEY